MPKKKNAVNNNFGQGVEVKVINGEHTGQTGKVSSDLDKDGQYLVKFDDEDAGSQLVHANDLDLAEEKSESQKEEETKTSFGSVKGNTINIDDMDAFKKRSQEAIDALRKEGVRLTIKSAEIASSIFCNFTYEEAFIRDNTRVTNSITKNSALPIHDDLKKAFAYLPLHLAAICEELGGTVIDDEQIENLDFLENRESDHITDSDKKLIELYDRYKVDKFQIKGNEDNEGVILNGYKILSTGEEVKLTAPKKRWDGDYHFINELRAAIDNCLFEVRQYHNGKKAPEVQGSLAFDSSNEIDEELR